MTENPQSEQISPADLIRARPEDNGDCLEPPVGRVRRCLRWIGRSISTVLDPKVGMAIVFVLLIGFFILDNHLDSNRSEDVRDDIGAERELLVQAHANLEGILCLADRVDLLLDIELTGRSIEDLSDEEAEILNTSCRDEAGGIDGGEGEEGDAPGEEG